MVYSNRDFLKSFLEFVQGKRPYWENLKKKFGFKNQTLFCSFINEGVEENLTNESSSKSNFSKDDDDCYWLSDDDSEVRVKS